MQDRYAGDVGDYGKIGLLRAIRETGLSIGVNWYKTEPTQLEYRFDGTFKQDDGKYHVPPTLAVCDPELAKVLLNISEKETRSIGDIQNADLIPDAVYYAENVSVKNRAEWHNSALIKIANADVVFLDPDNGLLVKSVGKKSKQSVKYAFYEEVADYVSRGQSVIVYNHRCRKNAKDYFGEILIKLRESDVLCGKEIRAITFPRYSVRDYFIICANNDHCLKIEKALNNLIESLWGESGMCRLNSLDFIDR